MLSQDSTIIIRSASSIAGFFHDIGKGNNVFAKKLLSANNKGIAVEAYRHEWISFKLFEAFVANKPIKQWLSELTLPNLIDEKQLIDYLANEAILNNFNTKFSNFDDFTKLVAWLILTHHKLPVFPDGLSSQPTLDHHDLNTYFLDDCDIKWNTPAYNHVKQNHPNVLTQNITFDNGLITQSLTWQQNMAEAAKYALTHIDTLTCFIWETNLLEQHLSRMVLMLADRNYSVQSPTLSYQDPSFLSYANTDKSFQLKQKLDEHNIGVATLAHTYADLIPTFIKELPKVAPNTVLTNGISQTPNEFENWQNKAVQAVANCERGKGFFGVNMASTGKGKTLANTRIMHALNRTNRNRLSIVLGLRTLTTQTGEALKSMLHLQDNQDIAVMVGSKYLEQEQDNQSNELSLRGSESLIEYDDFNIVGANLSSSVDTKLAQFFPDNEKNRELIKAPILVSTIDHLMPVVESIRGGHQIAPMLRLLSSDLIIDEPDDFSLSDLPALLRLVHFAGMLGCRVLLSSATIPAPMVAALFNAYLVGRGIFEKNRQVSVYCGWFDEYTSHRTSMENANDYLRYHAAFVAQRSKSLEQEKPIRRSQIVPVLPKKNPIDSLANTIFETTLQAHELNHEAKDGICLSVGLVRFANINPLVAIAKQLFMMAPPEDYCIHYCVYHSQFTIAQRSMIENNLDEVLNRKSADAIWDNELITQAMRKNPKAKHHIFVVLATPVCEIGRDHDYDWAIAELSSMRSLVQLSGLIQRHRKQVAVNNNLFILNQNFNQLIDRKIVYTKPGFESTKFHIVEHKNADEVLTPSQYQVINAVPCIAFLPAKKPHYQNLVDLENNAYWFKLLGLKQKFPTHYESNYAKLWLDHKLTWTGELQRQQRFRGTNKELTFRQCSLNGRLVWMIHNQLNYNELVQTNYIKDIDIDFADNVFAWLPPASTPKEINSIYAEVTISIYSNSSKMYYYNTVLGVFSNIEEIYGKQ